MTATIGRIHGLALPAGSVLRREPRRPRELQPADFSERFDFTTLFYDVFSVGSLVFLVGPPLVNLRDALASAGWGIDGRQLDSQQVNLADVDRTQSSWISLHQGVPAQTLQVACGDLRLKTPVSEDGAGLFAGRNVLLTLSKNNDSAWIRDWITFHRDHHAIDALLLYDNGSDVYTLETLRAVLEHVAGVTTVLIPWNYRFGPLGSTAGATPKLPWDSDFCQYGMLEHAKLRFLRRANLVVNADVDELLLVRGGESIGSLMDREGRSFCRYSGHWIQNIRVAATEPTLRHAQFGWVDPAAPPTEAKWSLRPQRVPLRRLQWRVHDIKGLPATIHPDVAVRHFAGITIGWRGPREPRIKDTAQLRIDVELRHAMTRSFGAPATG